MALPHALGRQRPDKRTPPAEARVVLSKKTPVGGPCRNLTRHPAPAQMTSADAGAAGVEELVVLFGRIGMDARKAGETCKNKKLSAALEAVIDEAGCGREGCARPTGLLLHLLASICTADAAPHRAFIAQRIMAGALRNDAQVQAAVRYCDDLRRFQPDGARDAIDARAFDAFCGVGVTVPRAHVAEAAREATCAHAEGLARERSAYNFGAVLRTLKERDDMRWADRRDMKECVDAAIADFLGTLGNGTVDTADTADTADTNAVDTANSITTTASRLFSGEVLKLHRPGENKQLTDEIMRKHLEATGGQVITRFPPEPNGFLHIGHAKAINFSFRYAEAHHGYTNLRYDDTNPEAEDERYYTAIRENVAWLGFTPRNVTYASDNFEQLYAYAQQLIQQDRAYVCHMTPEEIKASRGGDAKGPRYDSPWRTRPVAESLREFARMRAGEWPEGTATLRLKQDMQSGNPCMWDLVAYRVITAHAHHRTGTAWVIYPMYDFTHCLCDSIENITHSFCTTEFILAREAYYWVCDQLRVYKPVQWEYGRLNLTNTILSKRKLTRLVELGIVAGWDDPRLYTLAAVRRRGFPPTAVNRFVEEIGITTAPTVVDVRKLEACVRDELNRIAPRRMAVLQPLLVELLNVPEASEESKANEESAVSASDAPVTPPATLTFPNDPRDPAKGASSLTLSRHIYIDASDFRNDPHAASDPNYFRLAPGQPVGLFRAGVLVLSQVITDDQGRVTKLLASLDASETAPRPKTFIQFVPAPTALPAEIRIFSDLFHSPNPQAHPDGYLADINRDSLRVIPDALVDARLATALPEDTFQFQRIGYFCVDPDSRTAGKLVFNLTVSLKEDPNKN